MPKRTQIENLIPALYKRSVLNIALFAYIRGVRSTLPTLTLAQAVDMFMEDWGLDEDEFNRNSALTTYDRMQKELINTKSEK